MLGMTFPMLMAAATLGDYIFGFFRQSCYRTWVNSDLSEFDDVNVISGGESPYIDNHYEVDNWPKCDAWFGCWGFPGLLGCGEQIMCLGSHMLYEYLTGGWEQRGLYIGGYT